MQPLLYEINTRCWLNELSSRSGRRVTLADVPEQEFVTWRHFGFTHIWLMGVWTSGPLARAKALSDPALRKAFGEALPGWSDADVEGSPYAIAAYEVPESLGGAQGLRRFRERLNHLGIRLILDFVGNHLGLDHPWISERPGLFVQSPSPDHEAFGRPTVDGARWFACGKDPYFPAWSDTVQLDYRLEETHSAMAAVLSDVAAVCDGVRCDMAMLMLNEVFTRTWQRFPPAPLARVAAGEFWPGTIAEVKRRFPDFQFVAEGYWGLEERLTNYGFDFVYEKALLDSLVARDGPRVQRFLATSHGTRLARGVHFLENHDEARAAAQFSLTELKAATVLILALPGMRLIHDGQLIGARVRIPVQLTARRHEPGQDDILEFYRDILSALAKAGIGEGEFKILQPLSFTTAEIGPESIVAIQWQASPGQAALVAVNLASVPVQFRSPMPEWADPGTDARVEAIYPPTARNGVVKNLGNGSLSIELLPHGFLVARVSRRAR